MQIVENNVDAVIFSDFRHGIFNKQTIPELTSAIPADVYRVADSQVATRWGNILEFEGFDLITPNEREARFALGDQDSVVRPLALELHRRSKSKTLILKLGERGTITYRSRPSGDYQAFFVIDSFVEQLVDAVGAGDAMLAYSTLAMISTGNEVIASILGCMAAGVECEQDGNWPVVPEAVKKKIHRVETHTLYRYEREMD
jgi:sugar/nucleoside kinase (ribokinase family)